MSTDAEPDVSARRVEDGPVVPRELRIVMDALDTVFRRADVEIANLVAHEKFAIVSMLPEMRVLSRDAWLEGLNDYELVEWDLHEERFDLVDGAAAAHHRRAWRVSLSSGVTQSGEILVTDHWKRGSDAAWRVWQRTVTPLE